jgi:uncharacterized protein (DUF433 family)
MSRHKTDSFDLPNYGYQEAVKYLHIPHTTIHYWTRVATGLVDPAGRRAGSLSFKNLIECFVLQGLREIHGVKLAAIRKANDYLLNEFPSRHPLADYELKTDGHWIYFSHEGRYLNATLCGQVGLGPVLDSYLRRIERNFLKREWTLYPFMRFEQMHAAEGKTIPRIVSINPDVCFGMPVLSGTRITTAALASRRLGGESIPSIARGYGRPDSEIKAALRWETGKTRAAA